MRILLLLLVSFNLYAYDVQWSLQVTDPDYELTNYDLNDDEFKPFLKKTSWRCWAEKTESKNSLSKRTLRCNYSIEKTGEFKTTIACGEKRDYAEALIELYDEKKELTFNLQLICRTKVI